VATERPFTRARVIGARCISSERFKAEGRVGLARGEAGERKIALGGVSAGIASVRWWIKGSGQRRKRKGGERERRDKKSAPQPPVARETYDGKNGTTEQIIQSIHIKSFFLLPV